MSSSDRSTHALALLIAGALLFTGGMMLASRERPQVASTEVTAAKDYSSETPDDPAVRVEVHAETQADNRRQESELNAQWHAANAAWAGVWIAFWSLAGLAATAYFAYQAWRSSEKTLHLQRTTSEAELRAYLSIDHLRAPPEGPNCFVTTISNSGATPARGIHWKYRLSLYFNPDRATGFSVETTEKDIAVSADMPAHSKPHEVVIMASQAVTLRGFLSQLSPSRPAVFQMVIRYRDVFNRCFELVEELELGTPTGLGETGDHVNIIDVQSRERQITETEYRQPIHLGAPPQQGKGQ